MKELERTKRISVSAVLFLLIILIGFLTFKRPTHVFDKNSKTTLDKIVKKDYLLSMDDLDSKESSQYIIVDIRSNFEFEKGHLKNAINVSHHQVFDKDTQKLFGQLEKDGKTVVLYGEHPDAANSAWMLLYQLGYENIKILCVETDYIDNKFQIKNVSLEKPAVDYAKVMSDSKSDKTKVVEKAKPKTQKKVITAPKKKKRAPEGGC